MNLNLILLFLPRCKAQMTSHLSFALKAFHNNIWVLTPHNNVYLNAFIWSNHRDFWNSIISIYTLYFLIVTLKGVDYTKRKKISPCLLCTRSGLKVVRHTYREDICFHIVGTFIMEEVLVICPHTPTFFLVTLSIKGSSVLSLALI